MGQFPIQLKRNKKSHRIIQGHVNKNNIQNAERNAKHNETTSMSRKMQQMWPLANEIFRLPTKMKRTNIPHLLQRTFTSN